MTLRQSLLKTFYPVLMFANKILGSKQMVLKNTAAKKPFTSFYDLKGIANDGRLINFDQFKGRKVLLVNTASDCGYTHQYEDLEELYKQYNGKLVVIGFPANNFKEQEKGSDEEIASFCKLNYGVTFLIMKKSSVIKDAQQNEVFKWLTDSTKNGWNNQQPVWNFSKYLVDENGMLERYFDPSVSPLNEEVLAALK